MNAKQIRAHFEEVLKLALGLPEGIYSEGLRMGSIEQWDSFAHINLMLAIEDAFQIEFDSAEIGDLLTVSSLIEVLLVKLSAPS